MATLSQACFSCLMFSEGTINRGRCTRGDCERSFYPSAILQAVFQLVLNKHSWDKHMQECILQGVAVLITTNSKWNIMLNPY